MSASGGKDDWSHTRQGARGKNLLPARRKNLLRPACADFNLGILKIESSVR